MGGYDGDAELQLFWSRYVYYGFIEGARRSQTGHR